MLDNFDHIKAFWIMLGIKISQISLSFGVDDIDGTVAEERITHSAGAETPEALTVNDLKSLIEETGREPVERDTLYNRMNQIETINFADQKLTRLVITGFLSIYTALKKAL